MVSAIDATVPVFGSPTTASVRNNFLVAKNEITALQNAVGITLPLPIVSGGTGANAVPAAQVNLGILPITGGTMTGLLRLSGNPTDVLGAVPKQYVDGFFPVAISNGGTGANNAAGALTNLGAAPLSSPAFTGLPTAPTQPSSDASTILATTGFVHAVVAAIPPAVLQVIAGTGIQVSSATGSVTIGLIVPVAIANGGTGATNAVAALGSLGAAPLATPTFTGVPAAPTAPPGTNTTQLATTAFVTAALASGVAGVTSIIAGSGITVSPTGGTGNVTVALVAPVAIANGGTGATSGNAALDSLLGGVGTATGAILRQPGGAYTIAAQLPVYAGGTGQGTLGLNRVLVGSGTAGIVSSTLISDNGVSVNITGPVAVTGLLTLSGGITGPTSVLATLPPSPQQGNLWFNTNDGQLYIYYNDGSSAQWVAVQTKAAVNLQVGPGLTLNNTTSPPTIDINPTLRVPTSVVVGNTIASPTTNSLTINDTATQPQAFSAQGRLTVASETQNPMLLLDGYGTGHGPYILPRSARGTAATPTAVGLNDVLFQIAPQAYSGAAYAGGIALQMTATEAWSAGHFGAEMVFNTIAAGTATVVNSLILNGNSATFSGNVTLNGGYLWLGGGTGNVNGVGGPLIYGDATNIVAKMPSPSSGGFVVQNQVGISVFTIGPGGQVTANSGYTTKAGTAGATTGNAFNISWGASGPAHLWIDNVDEGSINTTPSDVRLKTDIKPASYDALAAINAIALVEYDLNWGKGTESERTRHDRIGFTAQQLAECIPEAVTIPDDDSMLSVQLHPIVSYLIGAVQQLSAQNADLSARLEALEGARKTPEPTPPPPASTRRTR